MIFAAIRILFAMIAGAFAAMPAASQNPDATPTYGEEQFVSPLEEDPYEVRVQAGGPINASEILPDGCTGHIASAPDFELDYVAAGAPLYLVVESDSDTTLAINAPDGNWYCSDDSFGLNPMVAFDPAPDGHYTIWIGAYRADTSERALLIISENEIDDVGVY